MKLKWKIRTRDGYEVYAEDMCIHGLRIGKSFYPPEMIEWRRRLTMTEPEAKLTTNRTGDVYELRIDGVDILDLIYVDDTTKEQKRQLERLEKLWNVARDIPDPDGIPAVVECLKAIAENGYGDARNTARAALKKIGIDR